MSELRAASGAAGPAYRLSMYGGGIEEVDRMGLRDRIRGGDVTADTEISLIGSDDWRPAATYPELARYFEMMASRQPTRPGMVMLTKVRDVRPMSERIVQGLLYPVAGGEILALIGLAVFSAFPVLGRLATLAGTLLLVNIIRTSAEGRLKMPVVDSSGMWDLIRTYLRVAFVTLVSLAPAIAFGMWSIVTIAIGKTNPVVAIIGFTIALLFAAVYYPACLATVAVWDNILSSLNPVYVYRVIKIIGQDYFIVIGVWFGASAITSLMTWPRFNPLSMIPFVGTMISSFLSFYVLFYAAHLLGYAVYRHSPELGWE